MGKQFRKILATVLTLCLVATLCAVPMAVSAETPAGETYDTFDEITLSDLGIDAGYFTKQISAGEYTYTPENSSSNSVVLKFQWQVGALDSDGWLLLFDGKDSIYYGRSVWFRSVETCFGYGTSYIDEIKPGYSTGTHDVEFGRKLVTSGEKSGNYYFYLAVDDTTLASAYTEFDNMTNKIAFDFGQLSSQRFADYGAEPVAPETYDTTDEITLSDLGIDAGYFTKQISAGEKGYTANSTSNSVVVKFQWQVSNDLTDAGWSVFLDGDGKYDRGVWFRSDMIFFAPTSDFKQQLPPVTEGIHNVEFGRKLVTSGDNKDKYYFYLSVDGITIHSTYTTFDNMANKIAFGGGELSAQRFADYGAEPETFDAFDEITLSDLGLKPGNFANQIGKGAKSYDAISASSSVALKFKWQVGTFTAPDKGWMLLFDGNDKYDRCVWFRSDMIYFAPKSDFPQQLSPITSGTHDIEFGRKLVMTGKNKDKYYIYLSVDGTVLAGTYITFSDMTNKISFNGDDCDSQRFADFGQADEYEEYTEIGWSDLSATGEEYEYTYDNPTDTYSVKFKFRWIAGNEARFSVLFDAWKPPFCFTAKSPNYEDFGTKAGENGAWQIVPDNADLIVNMTEPIVAGKSYNIEVGRLKVKSSRNGRNDGKYYVYLMVDGELIQSYYYDGVSSDGTYLDGAAALSNKIYVSAAEGNRFANYREAGIDGHEGMRGDLDDSGEITADDIAILKLVILGVETVEMNEKPDEIANFNNDGEVNILDLVAMKKYFAPVNEYAKTGDLVLGTQEHLLESNGNFVDNTKTAEYIADATAALGADAYRLSFSVSRLFSVSEFDTLTFNTTQKALLREMVDELISKGITEILYVNDTFVEPNVYRDDNLAHGNTVPDPKTDKDNYDLWLQLNAEAFRMLAAEFPEIKYFEPFNEPNLIITHLEKYGVAYDAKDDDRVDFKYTVSEKAGIMADICWYVSKAVKSVNVANQVTTPSAATGANGNVEGDFIEELYKCIVSGNYPTAQVVSDIRIDNYFTIINIHGYPAFNDKAQPDMTNFKNYFTAIYDVAKKYNDGGSRVWLTETGVTDKGDRDLDKVANYMQAALTAINELDFIDYVFVYQIADSSTDMGLSSSETHYGLFYAGDDDDYAFEAKPIAKTVYSFFNDDSTDYTALNDFVAKYVNAN